MNVLYTFGGIPLYVDALLNKLENKGVRITVVTPQKGSTIGKGVKMVKEEGVYKHLITTEKRAMYGKQYFPHLPAILDEEKPDILVMGWPYFLQIFFQPALRRAIQRNHIRLAIREIPFQTPPFRRMRSFFRAQPMYDENMKLISGGVFFFLRQWLTMYIRRYCYSKAIASINYSTAAYDIIPSYGIDRKKIFVTYNSGDTESLFREKASVLSSPGILPEKSQRLIHIGRLVKWKRVDLLITALQTVVRTLPQTQLVVVGSGPEENNLKQQAKELGLENNILFTGGVYDPRELGAYMNESTVYVLAGMGGLSINDAMTYGLPIVCSVCDTTERDLVQEDVNGLFFEEGNAVDLADKLLLLLQSPERCKEMGQHALNTITEKINLETVSERYIQAYQQIMKLKSLH